MRASFSEANELSKNVYSNFLWASVATRCRVREREKEKTSERDGITEVKWLQTLWQMMDKYSNQNQSNSIWFDLMGISKVCVSECVRLLAWHKHVRHPKKNFPRQFNWIEIMHYNDGICIWIDSVPSPKATKKNTKQIQFSDFEAKVLIRMKQQHFGWLKTKNSQNA